MQEALREEYATLAAALAAERERAASQSTTGSSQQQQQQQQEAAGAPSADPLDAFMSGLATSIEHDKVRGLLSSHAPWKLHWQVMVRKQGGSCFVLVKVAICLA